MTISATISNPFFPANRTAAPTKQADFADISSQPSAPASASNTTATPSLAGQNIPNTLSGETTAALLGLQEIDPSTSASPVVEPHIAVQGRRDVYGSIVRLSDFKAKPIAELPEDQYQEAIRGMERGLEASAMSEENMIAPDTSYLANHPAMKPYATVQVGGKVVATIDNQGVMSTSDEIYEKLKNLVPNDVNGTNGPDLAKARADKIAQALGGKVVSSLTAITQSQFNANPIDQEKLRPQINLEAMKQDPLYAQIQAIKAQRAAFLSAAATQPS